MSGQSSKVTVLEALAERLSDPVGEADQARARLHVLDWVGCAVAGRARSTGEIFAAAEPASHPETAFFWGALGNVLEMDDVDKRAILHPGPTVIPAALAFSLDRGLDDSALLTAIVRGYEAVIRLGRSVGAAHYALWHSTGTCGPLGSGAACASVHGSGPLPMAHTLALAMSQMAGFWQTRHHPTSIGKQLHTAHAARAGVVASLLVEKGAEGPLDILEGSQGVFAATCPDGDAKNLLLDYGRDWLIQDVSFKPWPACRHAHAAIDAALQAAGIVRPEDIRIVRVLTYPDALQFCDCAEPRTEIEAKFSLQHSVAVTLLKGKPGLGDFLPPAIGNRDVADLRTRVEVQVAEPYASAYPERYGAGLLIETHRGGILEFAVSDALGDPENPLGEEAITAKALMLMQAGGLTHRRAAEVAEIAKNAPARLPTLLRKVLR